jgi:hypothetical protein
VFHKEVTSVDEADEAIMGQGIADAINVLATASAGSFMGGGAFVVCTTARRIPPAEVTRIFVDYSAQAPSILGEAVAAQSAMLFSMYPAPGAEIKSGRNYIPFLFRDQAKEGQILQASVGDLEVSFGSWLLEMLLITEGDLKPVLYRYATDILPAVIVDIAEMVLRPVLASQRRRVQHHQPFSA